MAELDDRSKEKLATCDPEIIRLVEWAIKIAPPKLVFKVTCGHRNEADQNKAFAEGTSKVKWPNSRHNTFPSQAVDLAPLPIDWNNTPRFHELGGFILGVASVIQVEVEWGGHWNWIDRPHFEKPLKRL